MTDWKTKLLVSLGVGTLGGFIAGMIGFTTYSGLGATILAWIFYDSIPKKYSGALKALGWANIIITVLLLFGILALVGLGFLGSASSLSVVR